MRDETMIQEAMLESIDMIDSASFVAECEVLSSMAATYLKSAMIMEASGEIADASSAEDAAGEKKDEAASDAAAGEKKGFKPLAILKKIWEAVIGFFKRLPGMIANLYKKIKKYFADKKQIKNSKTAQAYKSAGYVVSVNDSGLYDFGIPNCMSVKLVEEALSVMESEIGKFMSFVNASEGVKTDKRSTRGNMSGIIKAAKGVLKAVNKRATVNIRDLDASGIKGTCDKIVKDLTYAKTRLEVIFEGGASDVNHALEQTKGLLDTMSKVMEGITKGAADMAKKNTEMMEKVDKILK